MYTKEQVYDSLENYNDEKWELVENSVTEFRNHLERKLEEDFYSDSEEKKSCLFSHLIKTSSNYDRSHVEDLIKELENNDISLVGRASRKNFTYPEKEQDLIIMGGKLSAKGSNHQLYQRITPNNYERKRNLSIIWVLGNWRTSIIINHEKWQTIMDQLDHFLYYNDDGEPKGIDLMFKFQELVLVVQTRDVDAENWNIPADEVLNQWQTLEYDKFRNLDTLDFDSATKIIRDTHELVNLLQLIEKGEIEDNEDPQPTDDENELNIDILEEIEKKYWIFQSNPNKFDLERAIKELKKDTFTVRQHSDKIEKGDKVIFWVSGGDSAGIVGHGEILTNQEIIKPNPKAQKYLRETSLEAEEARVWVSYNTIPNKFFKSEFLKLLNSNGIDSNDVSILKQPLGTNFPIDSKIYHLILSSLKISEIEFSIENLNITPLHFTETQRALLKKRIINALKAGKSIIFIGPPGSGKSKLAELICTNHYCLKNFSMCTATSDWSTFETIGGYQINEDDGKLEFLSGLFLKCFKDENENDQNRWLIIDEINRADIDKAFGALFSALAGDNIDLPYKKGKRKLRLIGNKRKLSNPKSKEFIDYVIPDDWRIIATMNSFDKTSLYEMSYAFMRRFAFIPVQIPREEEINAELITKYLEVWEKNGYDFDIKNEDEILKKIAELWNHINQFRKIGPALIEDICKFVNEDYNAKADEESLDWVSPIIMYVLPQFEGLLEEELINFYEKMPTTLEVGDQKAELKSYMEEFFGITISEQKSSQ